MLRVAILDNHPAVLLGLQRLVERTAGLEAVLVADDAAEFRRALEHVRADVVVLDYDLGRGGDGLALCHRLRDRIRPPAVVVYSAYAGPGLAVAARVAGAQALIDKRAPADDLVDAIRRVAAGEILIPEVERDVREAAIARLDPEQVPVVSMRLAGTSHQGIAEALGTDRRDVVRRVDRIVGQLRPKPAFRVGRQPERAPWAVGH
ncbi:MAG TPA: response regulator transcription factor [Solirubrobacteraceae bacterium]|nr:response regulator transcription factor [Solirubrobacteraceae bacterium]